MRRRFMRFRPMPPRPVVYADGTRIRTVGWPATGERTGTILRHTAVGTVIVVFDDPQWPQRMGVTSDDIVALQETL